MAEVSFRIQKLFFTADAVTDRLAIRKRAALSKAGAYVRKTAMMSLKYRALGKYSTAGQPPFVHRGRFSSERKNKVTGAIKTVSTSPLRELLFFAYDPGTESTVVGPALFRSSNRVPRVLEVGGRITIKETVKVVRQKARTQKQADAYRAKILSGQITVAPPVKTTRTITIAKRPTMMPALLAQSREIVGAFTGILNTA